MKDQYIFRETINGNIEYCGFMNTYYSKDDKKQKIEQIQKAYPDNIIMVMTEIKTYAPIQKGLID